MPIRLLCDSFGTILSIFVYLQKPSSIIWGPTVWDPIMLIRYNMQNLYIFIFLVVFFAVSGLTTFTLLQISLRINTQASENWGFFIDRIYRNNFFRIFIREVLRNRASRNLFDQLEFLKLRPMDWSDFSEEKIRKVRWKTSDFK